MSAVVIASVTAAITSQSLVGSERVLSAASYGVPSITTQLGLYATQLGLYALLALVIAAVGLFFLRFIDTVETFAHRNEDRLLWLRPVLGGLLVAGLVFVEPALFGTGQEVTRRLLLDEFTGQLWWVLLLLGVGKAIATSLTISSGGSGGAFMPSLFMGAAVGAGFVGLADQLAGGDLGITTGAFAVVGMAAMFAVVARAPLTAILIVFELTGDYSLIIPLMLVATLGTFIAERFHKESVYTLALKHKGIRLTRSGEVDILDTVNVGSVMASNRLVASPEMTVNEAERMMTLHRYHGVPVVDNGELVGVVTVTDMNRTDKSGDIAKVGEVMTPRPVTVEPESPVSRALERMAALGVGRLPVVATDDPRRLVGMFRREDAVRAYHEALTSTTDHHLHRLRLAQRTQPGAGYYDFRVPVGSIADGRKVRDVSWPEGSTLVSVRRGRDVLVPDGETGLFAGDVVTAFGTEGSRRRMIDRLNAGADEPTAEIPLVEAVESDEQGSVTESG
ncbi:MAG TPA: chloride channel protein, partial [Acidimicrobiia bacterium]|nr:chloride channel protein [Acidimicrobiia bacterium]